MSRTRSLIAAAALASFLVLGVSASLGDTIGSTLANDPTTSGPCTGQGSTCVAFQVAPAVVASSAGTIMAFRLKKKDGALALSPAVVRKNADGTYKVVKIGEQFTLPPPAGTYDETLTTPLDVQAGDFLAVAYAAGGPHAYHVTYHADGSFTIGYVYNASEGGSYTPQSDKYELLVQWTVAPLPKYDLYVHPNVIPAKWNVTVSKDDAVVSGGAGFFNGTEMAPDNITIGYRSGLFEFGNDARAQRSSPRAKLEATVDSSPLSFAPRVFFCRADGTVCSLPDKPWASGEHEDWEIVFHWLGITQSGWVHIRLKIGVPCSEADELTCANNTLAQNDEIWLYVKYVPPKQKVIPPCKPREKPTPTKPCKTKNA